MKLFPVAIRSHQKRGEGFSVDAGADAALQGLEGSSSWTFGICPAVFKNKRAEQYTCKIFGLLGSGDPF